MKQDLKNRQNSTDDLTEKMKAFYDQLIRQNCQDGVELYEKMIGDGVAKECARAVLPMNCKTRLYMTGSIRSWIHYLEVRTECGTQKEHREIALEIKEIFKNELPIISKALGY